MSRAVLGSQSPLKIEAVKQALRRVGVASWWEVIGCAASSGVREQPVGFEEMLTGAKNRALGAQEMVPGANFYIGIESGVLRAGGVSIDFAVVVILIPTKSFVPEPLFYISTSPGVTFPEAYVNEALERGWTVGQVVARHLPYADAANPHAALTGMEIARTQTLVDGVATALRHMHPMYFGAGLLTPPHQ